MPVISEEQMWPFGKLAKRCLLAGFGLACPPFIINFIPVYRTYPQMTWAQAIVDMSMFLFIAIAVCIGPIVLLIRWRLQVVTPRRRRRAILWTSAGLMLPAYAFILVHYAGNPIAVAKTLLFHLALLAFGVLCSLPMWMIIRRFAAVRLQDGASCPGCGHCVRGVTSQVCPECGRGFDASDLGLALTDFEKLIAGGAEAAGPESANHPRVNS